VVTPHPPIILCTPCAEIRCTDTQPGHHETSGCQCPCWLPGDTQDDVAAFVRELCRVPGPVAGTFPIRKAGTWS
jgi:hypothetical protein